MRKTYIGVSFSLVMVAGCDKLIEDWVGGGTPAPAVYEYCTSVKPDGDCCTTTTSSGVTNHQCVANNAACSALAPTASGTVATFKTVPGPGFCEAKAVKSAADIPYSLDAYGVVPHNCAMECSKSPMPGFCTVAETDVDELKPTLEVLERIFDTTTTQIPASDYLSAFGLMVDACSRGNILVSAADVKNTALGNKACNIKADIKLGLSIAEKMHVDVTIPPELFAVKDTANGENRLVFGKNQAPLVVIDYSLTAIGSGRLQSIGYSNKTLWLGVGPRCIGISKK